MSRVFLMLSLSLLLTEAIWADGYSSNCKVTSVGWESATYAGCMNGSGSAVGDFSVTCGGTGLIFTIPDANAQRYLMYLHALGTSNNTIYYKNGGGTCSISGSSYDCRCSLGVYVDRIN